MGTNSLHEADAVAIGVVEMEVPGEREADADVIKNNAMAKKCIDHLTQSLNQVRDTLSHLKSKT